MNRKVKANVLDFVPQKNPLINWETDESGIVVLVHVNSGVFNTIAQKLSHSPKISYIELDNFGSYIWTCIDENKTIFDISLELKNKFGDNTEPLYERILKYFRILQSNKFITLKQP